MIDAVDQSVLEWIRQVAPEVSVTLDPPFPEEKSSRISVYLAEVSPAHSTSAAGNKRQPLQTSLRYVISTCGGTQEDQHRLFGPILFEAMEQEEFKVVLTGEPPGFWSAMGVPPRPSFSLTAPCIVERPMPPMKYVKKVVLKTSPMRSLQGVVLGPGDIPLAGARVEWPTLDRRTRTDSRGKFQFAGLPGELAGKSLRVRAKGREMSLTAGTEALSGEPWRIQFDLKET